MSRVQAIERAFAVLAALGDGPAGVTAVAAATGLPKSTVVRILRALQREDAVEQDADDARYRLGPRVASLAANGREPSLAALARPHLADLAAATGEAAGLAVREDRWMHYVVQVDTPNPIAVRDWTGTHIPMHAVSSGQAVLAAGGSAALASYLELPLERFTELTLVDAKALAARLELVRRQGYALVDGEYMEGLASVAVAVPNPAGPPIAAVHVHGPSYRFPRPGETAALVRRLVVAARRIGEARGRA